MNAVPNQAETRRFLLLWEKALRALQPPEGARLLAAVSGGCDSVCLAALLRHSAGERAPRTLALGHVHHGLRPEADAEEAFVRRLGESWGLPVFAARIHPRETALARGWSLEQAARADRRDALARLCREARCGLLALGHQMDDQAETLLLRLLRGAGPRGLGGMEPSLTLPPEAGQAEPITLIRPLLGWRRRRVRAMARALGLEWLEDASNLDPRHARNRVRHELIPTLERDYNPRVVRALAGLADRLRRESAPAARAAEEAARRCVRRAAPGETALLVDLDGLVAEPEAVTTRVLWLAYQRLAGPDAPLGGAHMRALWSLAAAPNGPPAEVHLPGAVRARRRRSTLRLEYHDPRPGNEKNGAALQNPVEGGPGGSLD